MTELLILVRSALEGRPVQGTEYEALCRWGLPVWENAVEQARRQSVLGLVYSAVTMLPEETPLPEDIAFQLVAEGAAIEAQGRSMAEAAEGLLRRFTSNGMHPVLMKGPETARFYPCPLLREYGDIDLYLPPGERVKALEMIRQAGFDMEEDADGSLHFETDGIDADIHHRYYDLSCPVTKLPPVGTPEATLLMLTAHAMKHAIGPGIGLRQLCDVAAAFRALEGRYEPEACLRYCREAGILRWARLQSRFLSEYLGVPDRLFPENKVSPAPLMAIVQEGGNFGHHARNRLKAIDRHPLLRKADTAFRFIRHLPFSLRYAPREVLPRIRELIRGNRKIPRLCPE